MPQLRSFTTTSIGLLAGITASVLVYLTHFKILYSMVYSTYFGLINSLQFYEVAWILATFDFLLNLMNPFSFFLWVLMAFLFALILRNMNATLTVLAIAVLLPAGTWLLFAVKYAVFLGFTPPLLFALFLCRLLFPLALVTTLASLTTLPFWMIQRRQGASVETSRVVQFACSSCGAKYRSKPLICVECGREGVIYADQE
ncbi:MAG: hypothetical protein ACFE8F_01730 [Promethearchaeota archaeon]